MKTEKYCPFAKSNWLGTTPYCDTQCSLFDTKWDRCSIAKIADLLEAIDNNGILIDTRPS